LNGEGVPKRSISLGLKMYLRGFMSTLAIQSNRDWVWPFWLEVDFLRSTSAPSYFGKISFKIFADKKEVWLELGEDVQLSTLKKLIWHLPFKPTRTFIDGDFTPLMRSEIHLSPKNSKVVVVK
jgi:hypothetical protein